MLMSGSVWEGLQSSVVSRFLCAWSAIKVSKSQALLQIELRHKRGHDFKPSHANSITQRQECS